MLQNATPLRKSAPGPPNISHEHVSCTAPATQNVSLQILFKCPTPANAFETATKLSRSAHFWQGAQSLAPATQKNIWTSKSAPNPSLFLHFWHHHNAVHFLNISSSKSAPNGVLCTFLLQRRALFRHLNFQKCSEREVFLTLWLGNVLRATTACNLSSLIWSDGSAPAALASLLFDSPGLQNIGKNTVFRDFSTFSRACIFFLLTLSLPTSAFSCVHIVGSLTSKLPSTSARLSMGGPEGSLSTLLIVAVQKCETTPDASSFERRNDTR